MIRVFHTFVFLIIYLAVVSVAQAATPVTVRVSVDSNGNGSNGLSENPVISSDNRYVAFQSWADNLVPDDTNGYPDIFVHDRQTGRTERISVDSSGFGGAGYSYNPSISGDGRFVAFDSSVSTLVPGDTNDKSDIFVYDRQTSQPSRASIASAGVQGNADSNNPSISGDGRYVAFGSFATNLASGDSNGMDSDIYVHDRQTGQTNRVSIDSNGSQGSGGSYFPVISADGRYVAFVSDVSTLVSGDTNGLRDVFIHDRQTGQTTRVNVDSYGNQATGACSDPYYPNSVALSNDGRYVAFDSCADNLVAGDTNASVDIFVHDRQTGATGRVSVDSSNIQGNFHSLNPSISGDGRYVAFDSGSSNLAPGDTNGARDIFIHDRQTGQTSLASVNSSGNQGSGVNPYSGAPFISGDGSYVVFLSAAVLCLDDTNDEEDIFVRGPLIETGNECPSDPVRLGASSLFPTIQSAYDFISTGGSDTIILYAGEFAEDLVFDRDVTVTMNGGYDCDFNEPPFSFSTINSLIISNGTVTVADIVIQASTPGACDSSHLELCATGVACTGAGGQWSDNTCFGLVTSAGQVWMDRNLGAFRVATSPTDALAYGDLYQWGRGADGHQFITDDPTGTTTTTTSSTDNPGHGDFILVQWPPYDWRAPQKNTLWQGVNGINNVCPTGFRLPTAAEWQTERLSWSSNDADGAFASPLKLVLGGYRCHLCGNYYDEDSYGYYWSSTVQSTASGNMAHYLFLKSYAASVEYENGHRAWGYSVRCIQD